MAATTKKVSFASALAGPASQPKSASTLLPTQAAPEEDDDDDVEMDFAREPLDAPRSPLQHNADIVMLDSSSLAPPQPVASTSTAMDVEGGLKFPAAKDTAVKTKSQIRRVPIPPRTSLCRIC
jgi:hypothetical protein